MPATPQRSAYDILGVPQTASLEEIKKRYREMARQYHPDANQNNPSAGAVFAQISGAYKTLSDPDARAVHDAELALKERQTQTAASRAAAGATRPPGSPGGPTPPAPGTVGQRAYAPPRSGAAGNGSTSSRISQSAQVTEEARAAFHRGKFVEARARSEEALRLNSRNAQAYEVLGDVYRLQGKTEQAMNMYSMSLQINPRNPSVMQRLERMARAAGSNSDHTAQRVFFDNSGVNNDAPRYAATTRSDGRTARGSLIPEEKRSLGLLLVGFVGYAGVFLMLLYAALYHGEAPRGTPLLQLVSSWNGTILTVLGLSGAILGATMTITGAIRRIDDELLMSGIGRGGSYFPLGLVIVVLSVLNFYLAAAVFTAVALMQDSFTASMKRVFGAVLFVVLVLAAAYAPGHLQVLLWGGNVVFLAYVVGWLLGDVFRPESL